MGRILNFYLTSSKTSLTAKSLTVCWPICCRTSLTGPWVFCPPWLAPATSRAKNDFTEFISLIFSAMPWRWEPLPASAILTSCRAWSMAGKDWVSLNSSRSTTSCRLEAPTAIRIVSDCFIRLCLYLQVEIVFIPPGEPWRNGVVEKFNDVYDKLFFRQQQFKNLARLRPELLRFEAFHDHSHRYAKLAQRTP